MKYLEAIVHERYSEALSLLTERIESDSETIALLNCRAAVFFKLGRLDDCEKDCKHALTVCPNNIDASYWYGLCLFYRSSFGESRRVFEKIVGSHPRALEWMKKCDAELPASKTISHEWTQTDTQVVIIIRAAHASNDSSKVLIGERELSVTINQPSGKDYLLALDLFDRIEKDTSKVEFTAQSIVITLSKANPIKWTSLEYKEAEQHNYPTSSKVKKDWSKIDRQCDAELRTEKDTGEAALNSFFREIYGNADEATRRAMIKSFQTSGGTVLSTNWDEVKAADYEGKDRPSAPEGQEWKK